MRRVVAMMIVLLSMLALVLAQVSPGEPTPILLPPLTPVLTQDAPSGTTTGQDCDTKCSAECFLAKKFPKHYAACLDHCKKLHCNYPADLSYSIFKCTVTCLDPTSTKLAASDKVNEDRVEACYNSCKKNV
ncbi:hypothetical protein F2P56_016468 [Juglans regia]|uniref:Uncharacterized protein n=2 Tax=Juglans regia TaxID=51240 RepID=A0A834CV24_JUGRE|nr:uncharacterized protein LOC109004888 [Juglans regia]KAF5466550.1 hypothetical protein F2P56_016468 [Juglans regia]